MAKEKKVQLLIISFLCLFYERTFALSYRAPYDSSKLYNEEEIKNFEDEMIQNTQKLEETMKKRNVYIPSKAQNRHFITDNMFSPEEGSSNKYPSGIYYQARNYSVGVDGLTQDEPLTIEGKRMPSLYNSNSYPGFNPQIVIDQRFSLGEKERIKKALIIAKIMLHSDFLKTSIRNNILRYKQTYFGVKEDHKFYKDYFFSHEVLNVEKIVTDVHDIINNYLQYKGLLYINKSMDGAVPFASAGPQFPPKKNTENMENKKFDPKNPRYNYGIVNLSFRGKAAQYGVLGLPIILLHEITHVLGYNHENPTIQGEGTEMHPNYFKQADISFSIAFNLIISVYEVLDIPYIPVFCYSGSDNDWNTC